jgi:membrane protein YdbS with pleckstrin-like domain
MKGLRQLRWLPVLMGLALVIAVGLALWWLAGLSLWFTVPLALVGLLINGFLAEWEDNRPGGFNNPK